MSGEELQRVTARREACRAIVDDLVTKTGNAVKQRRDTDVETGLQSLKENDLILQDLNEKILDLTDIANIKSEMLSAHEYSYKLTSIRIEAEKYLSQQLKQETVSTASIMRRAKLPEVAIKPFYGNLEDWSTFWDLYSSAIHDREDVAPIDKFSYLRGLLRGDAEKAIRGFKTTAANYDAAIKTLKERFGDDEATRNMLIERLIAIKPVDNSKLESLQQLGDQIGSILRSLQGLQMSTESHANVLIPVLCSKLTEDLLKDWFQKEHNKKEGEKTTLAMFSSFLEEQINIRRKARMQRQGNVNAKSSPPNDGPFRGQKKGRNGRDHKHDSGSRNSEREPSAYGLQATAEEKLRCIFCEQSHPSHSCKKAESMEMSLKRRLVRKNQVCWNCLRTGHVSKTCGTRIRCKVCKRKHNTLLHYYKKPDSESDDEETEKKKQEDETNNACLGTRTLSKEVILMTVTAEIHTEQGDKVPVRCLFDNGSEKSFMSEGIASKVGCKLSEDTNISIVGIGGNLAAKSSMVGQIRLGPCGKKPVEDLRVLILEKVCAPIRKIPKGPWLSELKRFGISPADEIQQHEGEDKSIDLLIGSDYYWRLVSNKTRQLDGGLMAVKTKLGWTLNGPVRRTTQTTSLVNSIFVKARNDDDALDCVLRSFWELEAIGVKDRELHDSELLLDKQEKERFAASIKQREDQHYEVQLPKSSDQLPEPSKNRAKARLQQLINKLEKTPKELERYNEEVQNLLKNEFAEKVPDNSNGHSKFYIPHRAVIRETSETTKVRIVFDGSAKDSRGISLNQCLAAGPNLNPDIMQLLLRYRTHQVVLVGDIEKAFLQIWIHEEDRDLCRFFWFDDPFSEARKVQEYRMTRVLFGLNCSPYLLAATLKYHIQKFLLEYPDTVKSLSTDMYVDDWITGGQTVEDALAKYNEATEILAKGGFTLRKWKTNSSELYEKIYDQRMPDDEAQSLGESAPKVLGMKWCMKRDTLVYNFEDFVANAKTDKKLTKRAMLSINSRIYDPVGLISPVTVEAKLMFQQMWTTGTDWDDEVPDDIQQRWKLWLHNLEEAREIEIPRYVGMVNEAQLHVFTDSSVSAFAAAIYLRYNAQGSIKTMLVASRTRVAPLKAATIHRLELMGMILGVRLCSHVRESYTQIRDTDVYFWSDSQVCLHWIRGDPRRWKPFVANRVQEIQEKTPVGTTRWRYCRTKDNPADLPSRSASPEILKTETMWFHGPTWLSMDEGSWPSASTIVDRKKVTDEQRKKLLINNAFPCAETEDSSLDLEKEVRDELEVEEQHSLVTTSTPHWMDYRKGRTFMQVIRITAWIMRYIRNLRDKVAPGPKRNRVPLDLQEVQSAETYWWTVVQKEQYPREVSALIEGKRLKRSEIISLDPYVETDGLIRIKGRLQESELPEQQIHPIIVNENHWLVPLYIDYCHQRLGHVGVNETLLSVREKCWIVRGRQVVKKYLRRCVVCKRLQGKAFNQEVAPLPKDRVVMGHPFDVIGIDFFGPIYLKSSCVSYPNTSRQNPNPGTHKSYGLIITCAKTRAVHLELLTSMETSVFLQGFQRFVSRRGTPSLVYSDNAKTFKRTCNILECDNLSLLTSESVQDYSTSNNIQWKFIAERAPWWGGMWERLIRNIKTILKKKLLKSCLTYEEMVTLLVEVEGIINSRPLTYTYEDSNEPYPISPSHLLIGKKITSLPKGVTDLDAFTKELEVTKRMKYKAKIAQEFWRTWKGDYLADLRKTNAKFKPTRPPEVGDVCVISDDNLKRCVWPLGVITETHVGRDGKIRSVQLRSRGKLLTRPIQRLVPLLRDIELTLQPEPKLPEDNNGNNESLTAEPKDESEPKHSQAEQESNACEPTNIQAPKDECELLPVHHIGGECYETRPKRKRRPPTYLQDYV